MRAVDDENLSLAPLAPLIRNGISPERQIYMSPIASDGAFVGTVHDAGMRIATPQGELDLDWAIVGKLAENLATAI